MECLTRIPYTSLLGFILVFIGAAVSSATLYDSLNRTNDLFMIFFFKIPKLEQVILFIIIAVVILLILSVMVLLYAFVVTGATRNKLYHRNRCLFGGRSTAAIMMFLLFCATIVWLCLLCINACPVLAWVILTSCCSQEIAYFQKYKHFRFNFSLHNYGIYPERWSGMSGNESPTQIRTNITSFVEFQKFCHMTSTIGSLYTCSLFGSVVVIIGLVTSIAALSSFYMRLKYTKQLTNLIVAFEDQKANELDYIVNAKAM